VIYGFNFINLVIISDKEQFVAIVSDKELFIKKLKKLIKIAKYKFSKLKYEVLNL